MSAACPVCTSSKALYDASKEGYDSLIVSLRQLPRHCTYRPWHSLTSHPRSLIWIQQVCSKFKLMGAFEMPGCLRRLALLLVMLAALPLPASGLSKKWANDFSDMLIRNKNASWVKLNTTYWPTHVQQAATKARVQFGHDYLRYHHPHVRLARRAFARPVPRARRPTLY